MARTDPRPHTRTSKDGGVRVKRHFRASDAEWEHMREKAGKRKLSISEMIRRTFLRDMPKEPSK